MHSTLIFPIFDGDNPKALAVVELSHHDKSAEFANIIQLFTEAMDYMQLRTADVRMDSLKLGLRKWPVEVCSVPFNNIADSGFPKKHPHEQDISKQHILRRAMRTGQSTNAVAMYSLALDRECICRCRFQTSFRFFYEYWDGPIDERRTTTTANSWTFRRRVHGLSTTKQVRTVQLCSLLSAAHTVGCDGCRSHVANNSMSMDGALGFGTEISKCVSDSSSANTVQFPEAHSNESATPTDAVRVCQASLPIAHKADQDMHSDSPKEDTKSTMDDDKNSDDYCNEYHKHNDDGGSEAKKKENRLGGGAGKRLTYRDLEAHFGHGLKDAARRLGICPTTLKRACRRNGITRWPSRQISKLLKVWKQMGYKGEPPSWLLQNAISGNLRSENLAYILSSGLHVGLNPQRCECLPNTATVERKQGHVSLYCSSVHDSDPNGTMMIDEDIALKNLTHHGAFTAALHGTDGDGFAFQEEQDGGHQNNTWHAGHMANVVLHPSTFPCHSQSNSAIPVQTMHFSRDINRSKREGPLAFDLERTQRGGTGIIPVLSELGPSIDAEDVLVQPFHLPLGFDASQNLFH